MSTHISETYLANLRLIAGAVTERRPSRNLTAKDLHLEIFCGAEPLRVTEVKRTDRWQSEPGKVNKSTGLLPSAEMPTAPTLPLTSPLRSGGYGLGKPAGSASPILGNELCEECDHPIRLHGKYGCEYERGDRPGGEGARGPEPAMAMGPCGCQEWEITEDGPDPFDAQIDQEMELERRGIEPFQANEGDDDERGS